MNIHKSQLFWGSRHGTRVLTHPQFPSAWARGTGKTVVARMVGQLLVEMGVIKKAFQTHVALEFGLFHLNSISHHHDSIRFFSTPDNLNNLNLKTLSTDFTPNKYWPHFCFSKVIACGSGYHWDVQKSHPWTGPHPQHILGSCASESQVRRSLIYGFMFSLKWRTRKHLQWFLLFFFFGSKICHGFSSFPPKKNGGFAAAQPRRWRGKKRRSAGHFGRGPWWTSGKPAGLIAIDGLVAGLQVPSGKDTKNYGKSPFLIGKSTINGHFQ